MAYAVRCCGRSPSSPAIAPPIWSSGTTRSAAPNSNAAFGIRINGGDHDHRNMLRGGIGFQGRADFIPIHVGHDNIEENKIRKMWIFF